MYVQGLPKEPLCQTHSCVMNLRVSIESFRGLPSCQPYGYFAYCSKLVPSSSSSHRRLPVLVFNLFIFPARTKKSANETRNDRLCFDAPRPSISISQSQIPPVRIRVTLQ